MLTAFDRETEEMLAGADRAINALAQQAKGTSVHARMVHAMRRRAQRENGTGEGGGLE